MQPKGESHETTNLFANTVHLYLWYISLCCEEYHHLLSMSMAEDTELGAFPGLTPTDRENLAGGDENFKPHNWDDLKEIIGSKHISLLIKPVI